jgi:hypothetical protein
MYYSHRLQSLNAYNTCDMAHLQPWVLLFGVVEGAWGHQCGCLMERESWMRGNCGWEGVVVVREEEGARFIWLFLLSVVMCWSWITNHWFQPVTTSLLPVHTFPSILATGGTFRQMVLWKQPYAQPSHWLRRPLHCWALDSPPQAHWCKAKDVHLLPPRNQWQQRTD